MTNPARRALDDFSVIVSGQGGDGSLTVTTLLADLLRRRGLSVYTERDVLSRVKGGYAAASLRASRTERHALGKRLQIVVAFEEEGVRRAAPRLAEDAVVVFDDSEGPLPPGLVRPGVRVFAAPFGRLAVRDLGRTLYKNSIATGIVTRLLGLADADVRAAFHNRFARLQQPVLGYNLRALDMGLRLAGEIGVSACVFEVEGRAEGQRIQLTGNEALAFGFLVAGGRFFTGYPITPATDILTWLERWLPKFGGIARQTEDELAGVNMALGAALAGVRTMTATSGPGLALMQEGISQSGSAEIPLVIADCQRGGPSTGLPTRPEQSDLNMMVFGGHGDFLRLVLTPGQVSDCFELAIAACNLAECYQCPVFIAMDQATCQNLATITSFDLETVQIDRGKRLRDVDLAKIGRYARYAITDDGVSPYTVPGTPGGAWLVTGNERNPDGRVSTDPVNRTRMVDKRQRKLSSARREGRLPTARHWGDPEAEIALIGVGGAFGPILEATESLRAQGILVGYHQPRTIWPVLDETISCIARARRVYIVEQNATGQLAKLFVREGADSEKIVNVLRYDGQPLRSDDVVQRVVDLEGRA